MAKVCNYCGYAMAAAKHGPASQAMCMGCGAIYTVDNAFSRGSHKVEYSIHTPPEPEIENLGMVRKQLKAAMDEVMKRPEHAIKIIEDAWVGLATCVEEKQGKAYDVVEELVTLREKTMIDRDEMEFHLKHKESIRLAWCGRSPFGPVSVCLECEKCGCVIVELYSRDTDDMLAFESMLPPARNRHG